MSELLTYLKSCTVLPSRCFAQEQVNHRLPHFPGDACRHKGQALQAFQKLELCPGLQPASDQHGHKGPHSVKQLADECPAGMAQLCCITTLLS